MCGGGDRTSISLALHLLSHYIINSYRTFTDTIPGFCFCKILSFLSSKGSMKQVTEYISFTLKRTSGKEKGEHGAGFYFPSDYEALQLLPFHSELQVLNRRGQQHCDRCTPEYTNEQKTSRPLSLLTQFRQQNHKPQCVLWLTKACVVLYYLSQLHEQGLCHSGLCCISRRPARLVHPKGYLLCSTILKQIQSGNHAGLRCISREAR